MNGIMEQSGSGLDGSMITFSQVYANASWVHGVSVLLLHYERLHSMCCDCQHSSTLAKSKVCQTKLLQCALLQCLCHWMRQISVKIYCLCIADEDNDTLLFIHHQSHPLYVVHWSTMDVAFQLWLSYGTAMFIITAYFLSTAAPATAITSWMLCGWRSHSWHVAPGEAPWCAACHGMSTLPTFGRQQLASLPVLPATPPVLHCNHSINLHFLSLGLIRGVYTQKLGKQRTLSTNC